MNIILSPNCFFKTILFTISLTVPCGTAKTDINTGRLSCHQLTFSIIFNTPCPSTCQKHCSPDRKQVWQVQSPFMRRVPSSAAGPGRETLSCYTLCALDSDCVSSDPRPPSPKSSESHEERKREGSGS